MAFQAPVFSLLGNGWEMLGKLNTKKPHLWLELKVKQIQIQW